MEGSRSWKSPWTLDTYADMARFYGVEYIVFPTDKFAKVNNRQRYSTVPKIDYEKLYEYHKQIDLLEKEGVEESIKPSKKKKVKFFVQ